MICLLSLCYILTCQNSLHVHLWWMHLTFHNFTSVKKKQKSPGNTTLNQKAWTLVKFKIHKLYSIVCKHLKYSFAFSCHYQIAHFDLFSSTSPIPYFFLYLWIYVYILFLPLSFTVHIPKGLPFCVSFGAFIRAPWSHWWSHW